MQNKLSKCSPTPHSADSTWGSLGWLRFILAAIVAASHIRTYYGNTITAWDPTKVLSSFNGVAAVFGFLLVSGYSIHHSLTKRPDGYLRRRFLRIYPMYLIAILLTVAIDGYWVPGVDVPESTPRFFEESDTKTTISNILMLQGILTEPLPSNNPLWTLSLEWWMYLLAPFLASRSLKQFQILLAALSIGYLSWIFIGERFQFYTHTLGALNVWFLGIFWVLGFWYHNNRKSSTAQLMLLAIVWTLTGINRESLSGNYQFTLAASCVIIITANKITLSKLLNKIGKFAGNLSYPLYLLHLPIFSILYQFEYFRSGWIMIIFTIIISAAVNLFIEKPLRSFLQFLVNRTNHHS